MTETPGEKPAEEVAAETTSHSAEVDASAEEVARVNEQVRDGFEKVRDGFEQLKLQLQNANALATTSDALLAEFKSSADTLSTERHSLEREKAALVSRGQAVTKAEQERDQGYADERAALDRELAERRRDVLAALESEISSLRAARLAEVTDAESTERERLRSEIAKERADWDESRTQQQQELEQQRDELDLQKGAVSARQRKLTEREEELERNEYDIETRSDRIERRAKRRSENLDEEVADLLAQERRSFESALQAAVAEGDRLRESIRSQTELMGAFDSLERMLGGEDPASVILDLNSKKDELSRLREELATRPTEEMRTRYKALEAEAKTQQNLIAKLERKLRNNEESASQSNDFKRANLELEARNRSLERMADNFEAEAIKLEGELKRLRAAYEQPAEIEARYKEIELPAIKAAKITPPKPNQNVDEIEWLNGIAKASDSYGLHFSPRILKAFHTALKTAEWSPLAVLAGVSGTGKSELPRLYSHFGGLYFEPLAVQPNWDSQESMLGFFNSIDNRFDAQHVLRFLAQSQKPWTEESGDSEGYPGLADAMCLVLLDEMNLAHPELYFAEFLSKLELRRGMKGSDVPSLPVKIGAGMAAYPLQLGRNVLWAGTMNQDETTKSLSDKVLDRSIIIHFPRPTDLKRRLELTALDERNRGASLHKDSWQSWKVLGTDFTDEEIKPYKEFIETMNASLAVAGRAIGHRVWQSVEYYMANHPDVRAAGDDSSKKAQAMHVAFEDQLVQKVMPKLRGIDTRGKSKNECLDKIRSQLVAGIADNGFNLDEDFDLATELGYGQFIWQSANYLNNDSSDESA